MRLPGTLGLRSPIGALALGLVAAVVWSVAGEPADGQQAQRDARSIATAPAEDGAGSVADVLSPSALGPGVRLLHAPSPDQPFGFDVAIEDRDGHSMDHFHDALARAARAQGQARIMVYGASHVASDWFTGLIRERLQARFGDAGHGFVLPVKPWRSYRQEDVTIDSDYRRWKTIRVTAHHLTPDYYGVAGVAVETRRAHAFGAVSTEPDGDFDTRASLFDLYYLKQPGGGDFDVRIDGQPKGRVHTRAPDFAGGYATYHVPDGSHRFEIRTRGNGKVRIFGVAMERDAPGVILDELGINGARARYQLLWNDALFREQLARRHPDLVVLTYGTNESGDDDVPIERYEQRLRRVVARVRETVPEASCLLIGPSDQPVHVQGDDLFEDRPRVAQIIDVQQRVAKDMGCGFYDLVAFQGGPMSMVQWATADPPWAQQDLVHFTRRGYERLGQALLDALLDGYHGPAGHTAAVAAHP